MINCKHEDRQLPCVGSVRWWCSQTKCVIAGFASSPWDSKKHIFNSFVSHWGQICNGLTSLLQMTWQMTNALWRSVHIYTHSHSSCTHVSWSEKECLNNNKRSWNDLLGRFFCPNCLVRVMLVVGSNRSVFIFFFLLFCGMISSVKLNPTLLSWTTEMIEPC